MFSSLEWSSKQAATGVLLSALIVWILYNVRQILFNVYFHPLSRFPAPRAAAATKLWKAYIECINQESFCHKLEKLHAQYGMLISAVMYLSSVREPFAKAQHPLIKLNWRLYQYGQSR